MEIHPQPLRHSPGVGGVLSRQAIHLGIPGKAEHSAAADIALLLQKGGGGGAVHAAGHGDQNTLGIVLHHEPQHNAKKVYQTEITVNTTGETASRRTAHSSVCFCKNAS